jgi:hypothetical protein
MTITARFASTCPCCRTTIAVGSAVEWSKGSPARHGVCPAVAPVAATAPRAARRANWRCTNPSSCGDPCCDGQCGY